MMVTPQSEMSSYDAEVVKFSSSFLCLITSHSHLTLIKYLKQILYPNVRETWFVYQEGVQSSLYSSIARILPRLPVA